jgi:hypothetical protein
LRWPKKRLEFDSVLACRNLFAILLFAVFDSARSFCRAGAIVKVENPRAFDGAFRFGAEKDSPVV